MEYNWLRMFFQNCWNCQKPTWSAYTLCESCKLVFELKAVGLRGYYEKIEGFSLHFLAYYQYGIEEKLVLSLKKAQCSLLNFDYVAAILIEEMYLHSVSLGNAVWVTPQSRHSLEIVKSINKITGLNRPELIMTEAFNKDQEAQKFKRKQERKRKSFEFLGGSIDNSMNFIFIDDVVTTGSTAMAAWYALGKPPLFQIWSLAYRARLAPGIII